MEVDTDVQNKDAAKLYLKIIKRYSPFDKYLIGEKVGIFGADGTGTQIYIWNLDEWGSDYSLKWEAGFTGGSSFHQGGIFIRSRRTRCRPGQMSLSVCLFPDSVSNELFIQKLRRGFLISGSFGLLSEIVFGGDILRSKDEDLCTGSTGNKIYVFKAPNLCL